VRVADQYRAHAQLGSNAAIGIDAVLGFHADHHQFFNARLLQPLTQRRVPEGTGPELVEHTVVLLVYLQRREQLPGCAAGLDRRTLRAGVARDEYRRPGRPCGADQAVDVGQYPLALPGLFGAMEQADLHIQNQ